MRFFDQCKRYKDIWLNQKEKGLFMSNPEMTKVQERLTSRLQVPFPSLTTGPCAVSIDHKYFFIYVYCICWC